MFKFDIRTAGGGSRGKLTFSSTRYSLGFTLIELMITVAIVAILSSVALPSYTRYISSSRITEATGALGTLRVRLEQYYQDNRNYGSTAAACGGGMVMPTTPSFTISCTWDAGATSQSYLATATGTAAGNMVGYVFTVNDANVQSTTMFAGVAVSAACWMKKSSDSC